MKAKTKKTRWLLIALLFGFLAAAGLTFEHLHGAGTIVKANGAAPTTHPVSHQPHGALLASIGGKQPLWVPSGARPDDDLVVRAYSNTQGLRVTGHSGTPSNTSTAVATGWSNDSSDPAAGTQPQSNRPTTPATSHVPQSTAGDFADNSYVPLDCELPAGCGANAGGGAVSRQPSGTSGGMPGVHNSGSTPPNGGSGPQTTDDNTNPGSPGLNTDPSNSDPKDPPVASAPELDPATLAGAVTLLLGALAVLRSRRARANY